VGNVAEVLWFQGALRGRTDLIYVTVGTHDQPFTRLVQAMDEIAAEIDERVIIQRGPSPYTPRHAEYVDIVSREEAEAYMREARLVVAQGGCGTVLTAIHMGKPLIIVPRRREYREHIDDHQVDLARALEGREGIRVVYDEQKLRAVLDMAVAPMPNPAREKLFAALREYVGEVAQQTAQRKRWPAVALLGILILALALRLWGIGWGLPNGQTRSVSYHPDENTYLHLLATMNPERGDYIIDSWGQSFVPYTLAALFKAGSLVGWFELTSDEAFYIAHPAEAAKMYLMGRAISIVTGLWAVALIYGLVRKARPETSPWLALLGAMALAVVPGQVVNCHYLETDLPVTLFVLLALYWLTDVAQRGHLRDYLLAGVAAGLAVSAKWSALLLLPLLLTAHAMRGAAWRHPAALLNRESLKRVAVFGLAFAAVFLVTNPYVVAQPLAVARGVGQMGGELYTATTGKSFWDRPVNLLAEVLPVSLGWGVYLLGWVGVGLALFDRNRSTVETLVLIWMLLLGVAAATTTYATIGRTLPLAAGFVVLAACAVARLVAWAGNAQWKRVALAAMVGLVLCLSLGMSTLSDMFFCNDTARQDASRWIEENVPDRATFGIYNHEPYWDDPDILYQDFYHPAGAESRYQYVIYWLDRNNPPHPDSDYLILTSRDVTKSFPGWLEPQQAQDLVRWMDEHYEVVAEFESTVNVWEFEIQGWYRYFFTPHIQILHWKEHG
jgi:beta-1,4-N-acetylglucosaminyltransferase